MTTKISRLNLVLGGLCRIGNTPTSYEDWCRDTNCLDCVLAQGESGRKVPLLASMEDVQAFCDKWDIEITK